VPGLALAAVVSAVIAVVVVVFSKLGKDALGDVRYLIGWRKGEAGSD
jgi:hypothetical protein